MADDLVNALLRKYADADPLGSGNGGYYTDPASGVARHPDLVNALAQAYAAGNGGRNRLEGSPAWPTMSPLPDSRPSLSSYGRPAPPRWEREVAEGISPTMGAYGLASLGTTAAMDAGHGKADPNTLAQLAMGIFGFGRRGAPKTPLSGMRADTRAAIEAFERANPQSAVFFKPQPQATQSLTPAIMVDGKVWASGPTHVDSMGLWSNDLYARGIRDLPDIDAMMKAGRFTEGFTTADGQFLNRQQAAKHIGVKRGSNFRDDSGLETDWMRERGLLPPDTSTRE